MEVWLHKGALGATPVLNLCKKMCPQGDDGKNMAVSGRNIRIYHGMTFELVSKEIMIFGPSLRQLRIYQMEENFLIKLQKSSLEVTCWEQHET